MGGALIKAYLTDPDINTQRAAVRAADEGVPEANAGYLPTISAQGNMGIERAQTGIIGPDDSVGRQHGHLISAGLRSDRQRNSL